MKVVQINCVPNGSTGKIASNIHNHLLELGHESYFAYGIGNCSLKNTFRISNWLDIHIHAYLGKFTGYHGFFSGLCTRKLIGKLKKIKPDIVHLHNLHGSYINIGLLFKYLKKYNIKTVFTLHDCWSFTGKCPHYTEAQCYKWKDYCHHCPQLKKYPSSLFFDISKKCYKLKKKIFTSPENMTITTVSNWLKSQAEMSHFSKYNIKTIYNGIDTDIFKPHTETEDITKKYNIPSDCFVILGVASNWGSGKGLDLFLELSKKLSENEQIVLVGLSQTQIAQMSENIIGISRTDNQTELAEIYSLADVFVNPSIEETFGLVAAEAMACGIPVIVTDSTACPEIVNDNVGFVVPPHDVNSVYENITKIKKEKKDYTDICSSYIKENFSVQSMVDNYIELYETLV